MDIKKSNQTRDQIKEVILNDFVRIMETKQSTIGKFIIIAVGIEFLGTCIDRQHMKATARSERRFNSAITLLFPKKYHHFVKQGSEPYLYSDFRCPVIHQFRGGKQVLLISDGVSAISGISHLSFSAEGCLILKAEDFFEDLKFAANELIKKMDGLI
jgi:sulfur transfer complex TusBCD TusB component (DsrH family)